MSDADDRTREVPVQSPDRAEGMPERSAGDAGSDTPAPAIAENDSFAERSRRRLGQTFAAAGAPARQPAAAQQGQGAGPTPGPSPAQRVDRQSGAPTTSQPVVTGSQQAVGPAGSSAATKLQEKMIYNNKKLK